MRTPPFLSRLIKKVKTFSKSLKCGRILSLTGQVAIFQENILSVWNPFGIILINQSYIFLSRFKIISSQLFYLLLIKRQLNFSTCTSAGHSMTSFSHKGGDFAFVKPEMEPQPLHASLMYNTMPHLLRHERSRYPALQILSPRNSSDVDVVIGIPTVKRDNENYLPDTIKVSLIQART